MVYPRERLLEFLRHELRWTIGLRNVRPGGHAAMGFTFGLPWTILAVLAAPSTVVAALYVLAYLVLRSAVYLTVGSSGLQDAVVKRNWWLAPLRDLANFGVWGASFFVNRICWRGLDFQVKKGMLIPLQRPQGDSALFSIDLSSGGPIPQGELGTARKEGIELAEPLVDFAARQADIAAFARGESASAGDD